MVTKNTILMSLSWTNSRLQTHPKEKSKQILISIWWILSAKVTSAPLAARKTNHQPTLTLTVSMLVVIRISRVRINFSDLIAQSQLPQTTVEWLTWWIFSVEPLKPIKLDRHKLKKISTLTICSRELPQLKLNKNHLFHSPISWVRFILNRLNSHHHSSSKLNLHLIPLIFKNKIHLLRLPRISRTVSNRFLQKIPSMPKRVLPSKITSGSSSNTQICRHTSSLQTRSFHLISVENIKYLYKL